MVPGDGLILLDAEGTIRWLDHWAIQLLPEASADWSGKPLTSRWPDLDQAVRQHAHRLKAGPLDLTLASPSGDSRAIRLFRTDSGIGIAVLRPEEQALSNHSLVQLFSDLFNSVQDALLITLAEPIDAPGPVIVYANRTLTQQTGYALHEIGRAHV